MSCAPEKSSLLFALVVWTSVAFELQTYCPTSFSCLPFRLPIGLHPMESVVSPVYVSHESGESNYTSRQLGLEESTMDKLWGR